MALLPCPECQKDVSDKAAACPHCGMPMRVAAQASPLPGRSRLRLLGGVLAVAVLAGAGAFVGLRRPDYSRVEQLRAEQDVQGTHNEHVRQRFFRLYNEHPKNAMYVYLWARCVDDAPKQLELSEQGIRADPRFSWNYNLAARALARLHRVPEAYTTAQKGAALDPGNMQLADKLKALKVILDHKLADEGKPAPGAAVRYQGLSHGLVRSPDRADLQAIEKTRAPDDKSPVSDAVKGFVVCANPYADACVRAYVPVDARFKAAWPRPAGDVAALKDNQLVTVAGTVVTNSRGDSIMLADTVTVEAP